MEAKTRLRTPEDAEDLVHGMAFLGTGGGGQMRHGIELLTEEIKANREVGWVDVDDLPPDAWTVTTARLGWIENPVAHVADPKAEELSQYGLKEPDVHGNDGARPRVNRQVAAVRALEKYSGVKIGAIVPLEMGGGNAAGSIVTAMRLGIPTVDGDYTGRAIPDLGNMKVEICGKRCAPISYVDRWDNVTIATQVVGAAMADRIGRMLCAASFGRLGFAAYLMRVGEAKDAMVRNTLTSSLQIGRSIRRGQAHGRPLEELIRQIEGWLLFKGRVTRLDWDDRGAFQQSYGSYQFEGLEEFKGQVLRVWFKNENHIVWRNEEPVVTSPDLITTVHRRTAVPVTNDQIQAGQELAVVAMKPLDPIYRTPRGLAAFSARHFGFDIEYVPVEQKLGPGGRVAGQH